MVVVVRIVRVIRIRFIGVLMGRLRVIVLGLRLRVGVNRLS